MVINYNLKKLNESKYITYITLPFNYKITLSEFLLCIINY